MTRILSALKQIEDLAACQRTADQQPVATTAVSPGIAAPPPSQPLVPPKVQTEVQADAPWCRELAEAIGGQLSADRQGAFLFVAPEGRLRDMDPLAAVAGAVARRTGGKAVVADCRGASWPTGAESAAGAVGRQCPASLASALPAVDTARLVTELRRDYQIVFLVGSYPIDTRTAFLAARCEGVYLVARLGETSRQVARRAVRELRQRGGITLGCVLLDLPEAG